MRVFREPEPDFGMDALTFALGAVGGLALGMLLARQTPPPRVGRLGSELRERARTVARRLRPARLRRMAVEQEELGLLEDAVLDAFLADEVLSDRGIDIGAISHGIVELSGSVWTEEEAERAVRAANAVPGVRTVVNRLEVEDEARHLRRTRQRLEDEGSGLTSLQHGVARSGGMGRRRQGRETDPDQPDESHPTREGALEAADQDQWELEGYAYRTPKGTERSEVQGAWRTNFAEDELDNQDPHGKHAAYTLDEPPQELNSSARVGEGLKTGEHLALEHAALPLKPHGAMEARQGEDRDTQQSS